MLLFTDTESRVVLLTMDRNLRNKAMIMHILSYTILVICCFPHSLCQLGHQISTTARLAFSINPSICNCNISQALIFFANAYRRVFYVDFHI